MKDSEKSIFEFSKEQYDFELQQQSTLNGYISIPIGIVTVVAGSLSFLFTDPPNWWSGPIFLVFFISYSLAVFAVVCIIVFIFLHQTGLKYLRVPSPQEVKDYHDRIVAANPDLPNLEEYTAEKVQDLLYEEYRKCAEVNFEKNLKKGFYFRVIKALLLIVVSITVVSYGIYNFIDKPTKVNRIYIENLGGTKMPENENGGSGGATPVNQAPASQTPPLPVDVTRPVSRLVTESFNPANLVTKENAPPVVPVAVVKPVSRGVMDSSPETETKK